MNLTYLFHSEQFVKQQGEAIELIAGMGESSARISIFLENGQALSPVKAPFGSFLFEGEPNPDLVRQILFQIENLASRMRLTIFTLVLPPDSYQPEIHFWLQSLLLDNGYQIAWQDLNFHLDLSKQFIQGLHRSERWKLNKAIREGYQFKKIDSPDWDFAYSFFLESRNRKGYTLSMEKSELEKAFELFPEHYTMYGILFSGSYVALAISIEVNREIEYLFYTADDLKHRKRSPMVLLHAGLVRMSQSKGSSLLDLGTSSVKGVVNNGVATFKRNLGATASLKSTFIRKFKN